MGEIETTLIKLPRTLKDRSGKVFTLCLKMRTSFPDFSYYHAYTDEYFNILDGLVTRFDQFREHKDAYDRLINKLETWMLKQS